MLSEEEENGVKGTVRWWERRRGRWKGRGGGGGEGGGGRGEGGGGGDRLFGTRGKLDGFIFLLLLEYSLLCVFTVNGNKSFVKGAGMPNPVFAIRSSTAFHSFLFSLLFLSTSSTIFFNSSSFCLSFHINFSLTFTNNSSSSPADPT